MFRSSTILRELVQSLAKVTVLLKHSVKLHRRILCGDVAACCEVAYVLFVMQTDTSTQVNFSQALYKLPEDGQRPKHVGAIIMCIFMQI